MPIPIKCARYPTSDTRITIQIISCEECIKLTITFWTLTMQNIYARALTRVAPKMKIHGFFNCASLGIALIVGVLGSAHAAPVDVDSETDPWRRARSNFVHWENPHVHPLDITPDQSTLVAVNTADNSLLVFNISGNNLQLSATIPVGLDPVSVRARTNNEVWVVNHVSDSVSIVNLQQQRVTSVLQTGDEPADVVFAGSPQKAFVSISQQNRIEVFNPGNPNSPPQSIFINGEDPRALAVSPNGNTVYLAVFESGNGTTLLNGGKTSGCCEIDIVRNAQSPYGGVGIPPNDGNSFEPSINPNITLPSAAPIIVRKDENNNWIDDNNGDWSRFVSGDLSAIGGTNRGRVEGWDLPDRDVAIINANNLSVSYQHRLMNANMAIAVHPTTNRVTVVGTEATNEVRWVPNLQSTFVRVMLATFSNANNTIRTDLNPHLNYNVRSIAQSQRDRSIGDPRAIAWSANGQRGYITGMGSNNVAVINQAGERVTRFDVGQGPTGIVLRNDNTYGYVLNKFDASISVFNINQNRQVRRVNFYDPSPSVVKNGRKWLYDTHANSGLGQVSCGSCHIDGRTDRLAWDLGDPSGDMVPLVGAEGSFDSPVKGPLLTTTLQDVVGHNMLHWAGDSKNLGVFDHAFVDLQGADTLPSSVQMLELEAFLATIAIPPSPNRNLDNSYNTNLAIPGPNGTIARFGNAATGAQEFESRCRRCHDGDSTRGDRLRNGGSFAIQHIRPPTWRNFHERYGLWYQSTDGSNSGFGFQQDGGFDSTHNGTRSNNMMAFMLSVNGRFPYVPDGLDEETQSHDAHAAVGKQVVLGGAASDPATLNTLMNLADGGELGLVVHTRLNNVNRGFAYIGNNTFQSDRKTELKSLASFNVLAARGGTFVFTAVPAGSETRIGIDRDMDGSFNGDEQDENTNPVNPISFTNTGACEAVLNVARSGQATQSSEYAARRFPARLAIDGNRRNFTHTQSGASPSSWSLQLNGKHIIESLVLHNRPGHGQRLRDLTLYILDESGDKVMYRSPFINRHNQMNSPTAITVDLVALTGAPVRGSQIRIVRTPDTHAQGVTNPDENSVLSLAEVEVFGCADSDGGTGKNLALSSNGATATQSSFWTTAWPASNCIDGVTTSTSNSALCHSASNSNQNEWWDVKLGSASPITSILVHNRISCCSDRILNMYVLVSDSPFPRGRGAGSLSAARAQATFEYQITSDVQITNIPVGNITGQYIRIQKAGGTQNVDNKFNLLEVQVIEGL